MMKFVTDGIWMLHEKREQMIQIEGLREFGESLERMID
jgi:hypothetical protein